MLLWHIEDEPGKELPKAVQRYKIRFGVNPEIILVNKNELSLFDSIKGDLKIREDKTMNQKEFGLL